MQPWPAFLNAMAMRESSGNYRAVNSCGFMGAFQFGRRRLQDLGVINADGTWDTGLNDDGFLANKPLQDACFTASVSRYARQMLQRYSLPGQYRGINVTLSGIVAACHLVGPGGVQKWMSGQLVQDGFGTTPEEYFQLFADYDIPTILPYTVARNLWPANP